MEKQISSTIRACYANIRNIGRAKRYLTPDTLNRIVHSLVINRLEYMCCLLTGIPKKKIKRLQSVLNSAARLVTGAPRRQPSTEILEGLQWIDMESRIKLKVLSWVYEAVNNRGPEYIKQFLEIRLVPENLRSARYTRLQPPDTNLVTYGDRSFPFFAATEWNNLPLIVRLAPSLLSFKKRLKKYFLDGEQTQ